MFYSVRDKDDPSVVIMESNILCLKKKKEVEVVIARSESDSCKADSIIRYKRKIKM